MIRKSIFLTLMVVIILIGATQCSPAPQVTVTTDSTESVETSPTTLDGQGLVETKCISCHGLNRIENQSMDANAWKSTVERMVKKGTQITAEEQLAIIDYLAETYP